MSDLDYLVALHSLPALGPRRLLRLLDAFGTSEAIWKASPEQLRPVLESAYIDQLHTLKQTLDPAIYGQSLAAAGIKIVTLVDADYPESLKALAVPPILLYYYGQLPTGPNLAIVGTRQVSPYGKMVTQKLAEELAAAGLTIVSGLARGVDTLAHQATIDDGTPTIAVLGSGLRHIFPAENAKLIPAIIKNGGAIITEYAPEVAPMSGNFPARNRIIAALSQGVLVTEANLNSGSLITAREALELGKEIYAVPGPINATGSRGVNHLLKNGAKLVTTADDILVDFGLDLPTIKSAPVNLSKLETQIIEFVATGTKHVDEINRQFNLASAEINATLIQMEIKNLLKNLGNGNYAIL